MNRLGAFDYGCILLMGFLIYCSYIALRDEGYVAASINLHNSFVSLRAAE